MEFAAFIFRLRGWRLDAPYLLAGDFSSHYGQEAFIHMRVNWPSQMYLHKKFNLGPLESSCFSDNGATSAELHESCGYCGR